MFDPTKPVQTRDGRKVRVLCTNRMGCDRTIVALVKHSKENYETVYHYLANGFFFSGNHKSMMDLVNIPEKRKKWVNVYADGTMAAHPTRTLADRSSTAERVACLEIEYTFGEGLEEST